MVPILREIARSLVVLILLLMILLVLVAVNVVPWPIVLATILSLWRSIVVSVFIVAIIRESGAIIVVVVLSSISSDLTRK